MGESSRADISKQKQNKQKKSTRGGREKHNCNGKTNIRIGFWNVHGLKNKDKDFWKYIETYEVIGMTETWTLEEEWEKIEQNLPKNYRWYHTPAVKIHRRGRAMGGIITGIRNNLREGKVAKREHQDIQERRVILENKIWRIYAVYVRENAEDIKQELQVRI